VRRSRGCERPGVGRASSRRRRRWRPVRAAVIQVRHHALRNAGCRSLRMSRPRCTEGPRHVAGISRHPLDPGRAQRRKESRHRVDKESGSGWMPARSISARPEPSSWSASATASMTKPAPSPALRCPAWRGRAGGPARVVHSWSHRQPFNGRRRAVSSEEQVPGVRGQGLGVRGQEDTR